MVAIEGIPQTVFYHRVDEAEIAYFLAVTQMRAVRCLAHAFLAASDDDIGVAKLDRLHTHGERPQA